MGWCHGETKHWGVRKHWMMGWEESKLKRNSKGTETHSLSYTYFLVCVGVGAGAWCGVQSRKVKLQVSPFLGVDEYVKAGGNKNGKVFNACELEGTSVGILVSDERRIIILWWCSCLDSSRTIRFPHDLLFIVRTIFPPQAHLAKGFSSSYLSHQLYHWWLLRNVVLSLSWRPAFQWFKNPRARTLIKKKKKNPRAGFKLQNLSHPLHRGVH